MYELGWCGKQGWCKWWEQSPPTNVVEVQTQVWIPHVGWVCCSFSPLLWKVFFLVLQFSPLLKNRHFQIPIRPGMVVKDLNHHMWGLLSVNSQGLLHPVMHRSRRSHWQSFIPLQTSLSSVYLSFFSRTIIQWNNLPAFVFSEHCSLDTFKAQAAAIIYLFISLLQCKLTFLFCWPTQPIILKMWGVGCTW